ncbi:MAG TPA: DUF309 domain-containing protein [Methylomirabilota bacterium]|nr:DUF309 domain-containing protein [Methylomirabilota bacterium]
MTSALPLRLRNRLAATILTALHDDGARRELAELSREDAIGAWLEAGEDRWAAPLRARARAASAALADRPLLAAESDLREALRAAALLFDAGLYFEVHEALEPHWAGAQGESREALQGLIQVAVAWQHFVNGNHDGARSLFTEGARRLHGARLLGLDLEPLARSTAEAAVGLAGGAPIAPPRFPSDET